MPEIPRRIVSIVFRVPEWPLNLSAPYKAALGVVTTMVSNRAPLLG